MHQLFLDANTYLAFYSLSEADISELGKLVDLTKHEQLTLLLPTQVRDEVRRNRAKAVSERLKALQDSRLQVTIPKLADGSVEATALQKAVSDAHKAHTALDKKLRAAASHGALAADTLIDALFAIATVLSDPDAYDAAVRRKNLGNPPGKGSSLGDGVNWELLLRQAKHGEDLCFVSSDPDFASLLDPSVFNEFLADEWWMTMMARVKYYRDIKQFLDENFPAVRLVSDVRKYLLIDALIGSLSFQMSHNAIAELLGYPTFTAEEAQRILAGGIENSQVRWIARDDDMKQLLTRVLEPHRAALPKELIARWDFVLAEVGWSYGPAPTMADVVAAGEKRSRL